MPHRGLPRQSLVRITLTLLVSMLLRPGLSPAQGKNAHHETATFAGGCFWCMEPPFDALKGVIATVSGYCGGDEKDPTYEEVSSGKTGHAESIQITYDPSLVPYSTLLEVYWHNTDPTTPNRQFCDRGSQYRPAIFYKDEAQKHLAEQSRARVENLPGFRGKVVTQIVPLNHFYKAEEYHQDFYRKNPDRYYSYRSGCGRDARLRELWGESAGH